MAIIKPNQPVLFRTTNAIDCSEDVSDYIQIVDNTDVTQFQFGLTICNGSEQVLSSPQFETPADYYYNALAWDISYPLTGATLCSLGAYASGVENATVLDPTRYYAVTIEVQSVSSGTFEVYLGSTYLGSFSEAGSYTWYGFPTAYLGRYGVRIEPTNATDICCMTSIEAYEYLTNFIFVIYQTDDTYVTKISYEDNPEYFTFVKDSVTITINWGELSVSNGCYYICLLDPCDNIGGQNYPADITNGTFTGSATGWTLGSAWTYSANTVVASHSGTAANNYLTQSNVFVNYTTTYSITVDITAISGTLKIYFGDNLVATKTTTGQHVITGVPSVDKDLHLYIDSGTCTVTSVTANEVTSGYTCSAYSNDFHLMDVVDSCPSNLLINACNDEDGLGFVFDGSGFSPRIRLEAKLKQAKYGSERVMEEDSDGRKRVIYYNRRKSKTLVADLLPEYIHDFLSTLIGYDRFYIDGTAYIVDDDEYNVTYDDSQDNIGSVAMNISEQVQLIKNVNCSSEENNCSIDGNYLLQADDNSQYITLVNGELIEING